MNNISAIIVALGSPKYLAQTIGSITDLVDEIIIVDSESTDETVNICRRYTDKIYTQSWQGCGPQKKYALSLAQGDWILCIDADERVSEKLKTEIQALLTHTAYHGFEIPFESYYCGKQIRFGDWFRESHLRLFKRESGTIIPRLVHFRIEVQGKIGRLQG